MPDSANRPPRRSARAEDRRRAVIEGALTGISAFAALLVSVYGLWMAGHRTAQEQVTDDLSRLASMLATVVDPTLHEAVRVAGTADSPAYQRAIDGLRRAQRAAPGVRYAYTMVRDGDSLRFILDTAEPGDHDHDGREDRAAVGEAYADPDPQMLEALGAPGAPGRVSASTTPYSDEWGTFISGYAPIRDSQSKQIGIVGIDVDARRYLADEAARRRAALLGLIPGALLSLGLGYGVYRTRRRQLSAVQRILAEQQRVADAELLASHQATRMRAIVAGTGVLAWEFDLDADRFTYVSVEGTGFGRPAASWLTPDFWRSLVHPDDLETVESFLRIGAFPAEHRRLEFRVATPGGSSRWLAMVVSPRASNHAATVLSGVLIDVTEARRLRDAAEAASRAKSEFVANMSHEIRTPLTAILGYAELLREDGDASAAPAARLQTIDTIRTAGQYLLNVINDILDLSKIEAGRMTVETIAVDLPALLIDCENLLAPRAAAKGLAFSVALETPLPRRAITDPTRLRQILLNLAGNAIKFTTTGHVTVRASVINPTETVQTLRLDVEDSGPGLTAEQASRLFQAFSQADSSVTRTHGGTGLGLTISRRLAGLMGGDVQLHRTSPGAGSAFRIEVEVIPEAEADLVHSLRSARSAPGAAHHETTAPARLRGRVLVAEDNAVNQRLLEVFLTKAGAQVDVVADGAQALGRIDTAIAEGASYDLLVTDVQMPVMDGYTLVRTLRARGCTIPVIALTANAMAGDRQLCLDAGCDDYAPKPIDLPGLVMMCAQWIDRGQSAAPSVGLALVPDSPARPPANRDDADPLLQTA